MVKRKLHSIYLDQKIVSQTRPQCRQVKLGKNVAQSVLEVRGVELL